MDNQIIIIKGLDINTLVSFINSALKRLQATLLTNLESKFTDEEVFKEVRKLILDVTNEFVRDLIRKLIGDVEV
ncbi:MAG: hypothetical protein ACUVT3_00695 [Ignavibacterium sp.]